MIAVPNQSTGKWYERVSFRTWLMVGAALIGVQALVLFAMGRAPICACGSVKLWGGVASGPEISQQLADWYTYSHVIHGVGFYFVLRLVTPHAPVAARLILALAFEVSWELFENTSFIINRYRQSAIVQGYFGDSIVNSVADTVASVFGFLLARTLPAWGTVALVIFIEIFLIYTIRDGLTLNVIQLIHPLDGLSHWQAGH